MKKKINRRTFLKSAAVGAIGLGAGGHLLARHKYGSSYPKRIPFVRRVYADKKITYDFYFGTHGTPPDTAGIRAIVQRAKKAGKPYNVMISEMANITPSERKIIESKLNRIRKELSNNRGKEDIKQVIEKLKRGKEKFSIGWAENLLKIAIENRLYFKLGEEHPPKEIQRMEDLYTLELHHYIRYLTNENQNEKRQAIKAGAEHLYYRDRKIARTMKQIRKEIAAMPEFNGKKIRAITFFGLAHLNVVRNLDRISRAEVKIVSKKNIDEYNELVIELSKKGLKAIRAY